MLLQSEIAGVWRRVLATVLDLLILHLGMSVVTRSMMLSPAGMCLVDYAIAIFYSGLLLGMRGQSLGKMALGLRVIQGGGGGLDYAQTFKRAALKWLPIFGVFMLLAVLMPDQLRNRGINSEMVESIEKDPGSGMMSSLVILMGLALCLFLLVRAKRHPDGQALHDCVVGTFVIKTM
jgi:uncharacterized RDD family membrane protein YckC